MGLSVVNRPIRPAGLSPASRAIALAAAPERFSRNLAQSPQSPQRAEEHLLVCRWRKLTERCVEPDRS